MRTGEAEKALVYSSSGDHGVLDESVRKSFSVRVEHSTKTMVQTQFAALKSTLEEHFHAPLGICEPPNFLSYGEGAYFKQHRDAAQHRDVAARRVSLVLFLNTCSKEPAADCYGGGALNFFGLMKGPHWEDCAFSIEAEPGMLVGFSSDIAHEVQPVTFGQRFTIASWFRAGSSSQS